MLGVKSPIEAYQQIHENDAWIDDPDTGMFRYVGVNPTSMDPLSIEPPAGTAPPWQPEPSNFKLNLATTLAADYVTRVCPVPGDSASTTLNIAGTSNTGPYVFNISGMSGFGPREVATFMRIYWFDGQTYQPIRPVNLRQLDINFDNYLNDGPGTPFRIAIEGQFAYLMPAPANDGTLFANVGGILAPYTDDEGFAGIPSQWDDAILYIALLQLAQIMPNDTEMTRRANTFQDEAKKSEDQLYEWFDNRALLEFQGSANYQTSVPRYSRRN